MLPYRGARGKALRFLPSISRQAPRSTLRGRLRTPSNRGVIPDERVARRSGTYPVQRRTPAFGRIVVGPGAPLRSGRDDSSGFPNGLLRLEFAQRLAAFHVERRREMLVHDLTAAVAPAVARGHPHPRRLLLAVLPRAAAPGEAEIGRASCRERVCQYV